MPEPLTLALGALAAYGVYKAVTHVPKPAVAGPPPPTPPIDRSRARLLAPVVAADIEQYLGFYDQGLLKAFKGAAGLRTRGGRVNAVYAGTTAGALRAYGVASPPAPLPAKRPRQVVPYALPAGGSARSGGFGVGFDPVTGTFAIASFVMGAVSFFAGALPRFVSEASWKNKLDNLERTYALFKETLDLLDELGKVFPKCRARGSDRFLRYCGERSDDDWLSMDATDKAWHTPLSFVRFPWINVSQPAALCAAIEGTPFGEGLRPQPELPGSYRSASFESGVWRQSDGLPNAYDLPETHAVHPRYLRAFLEPDFMAAPELLEWHGWTTDPEGKRGQEETNRLLSKEYVANLVGVGRERTLAVLEKILKDGQDDPWRDVPVDPAEVGAGLRAANGYTQPMTVPRRQNEPPRYVYGKAATAVSFAARLYPTGDGVEGAQDLAELVLDRGGHWTALQADLNSVGAGPRPPIPRDPEVAAMKALNDAFTARGLPAPMALPAGALVEDAVIQAAVAQGAAPSSVAPQPEVPAGFHPSLDYALYQIMQASPAELLRGEGRSFDKGASGVPGIPALFDLSPLQLEPEGEAHKLGLLRSDWHVQYAVKLAKGVLARDAKAMDEVAFYRVQAKQDEASAPTLWSDSRFMVRLLEAALRGPSVDDEAAEP